MKINKFIIIGIILLAVISFSTVSASENHTADNISISNDDNVFSINENNDEFNLNAQDTEDFLKSEIVVTPVNISDFEDNLITRGEYKFVGVFENLSQSVYFDSGCVVDASEAEFINTGVILDGNVVLKGLTITATRFEGISGFSDALVSVAGDNNRLEGLTITYSPQMNQDNFALYINGANNFTLLNSKITFSSVNLNKVYKYAIKITSSRLGLIQGNIIRADLPILDVDYDKGEAGLDTDYVLNTGIRETDDLRIINNTFFANVIGKNGNFSTLDCFMLENCNHVDIINNTFNETDFFTSQGTDNYLNVLDMYRSNNVLVQNNRISVETTGGAEDAGSAYPVQVTGPYENVVIDGNDLYSYCRGPSLGVYSQNFYGDTEIFVKNNKINVTGLPTLNFEGLVSGIELQDTVAHIYNNIIKTQSVDGRYQNGVRIFGVSYAQRLNDAHNYDIQGNIIETEGDYAIYLLKSQDVTIFNNSLISHEAEGNDAIYVKEIEGNQNISNNYGRESEANVVTPENFFEFFDDEGLLKDGMPFDKLIFKGEFDKGVSHILILEPLTLVGDGAVFKNTGVKIYSNDVQLINLSFVADTNLESLIYIESSNVNLTNLNVSYSADVENAVAVDIKGGNNVRLSNSIIFFESHVPNDENLAIALQAVYSQDLIIDNNRIITRLPCIEVNNYDSDYHVMGSNNVNPVRFKDCDSLRFTRNVVNSTTNHLSAEFPTIQSIYIIGCSNSLVDHNNISMIDTFTPIGRDNYMYGIDFAYNTNVTFSYNIFNMSTNGGKDAAGTAYAFQGVSSDIIIKGNTIISKSYGPNLGIYITSLEGDTSEALIVDNFINVTGRASPSGTWALVSGIEIQNGNARIYNNTIYTYNVNDYDPASYCYGISYAQWMYGDRSFDIKYNTVYTEGKYTISVIDADFVYTSNNRLFAYDLEGDYSINLGNCTDIDLDNNYPHVPKSDVTITIEVLDEVDFGETVIIGVTANANVSLVAKINGKPVDIVNGKITYKTIKGGLNTVNVYSRANTEFNSGNETKIFNVNKCDAVISLNTFINVKIDDTIVISPVTNSDGALTIKVNGVVVDGTYMVKSNGTYNVSVWSAETDNYKAGFNSTSFVVFKEDSSVDITLVPAGAGGKSVVYVEVTEGATGTVIVNVNGTEYPIDVLNNKLELSLDAGTYPVFATYTGDYKYNMSISETKSLIIEDKKDANIIIPIPDVIKIGDTIVINPVTDSNGTLTIKVNGVVVDGSYTIHSNGTYNVSVWIGETDTYKAGFNSTSFVVFKEASSVNVTLVPARAGGKSVVYVNVTEGATGTVVVNVNGTEYPIDVLNNKLELSLDEGIYPVFATYNGDYKYNMSVSDTKSLVVEDKIDANIQIRISGDFKIGNTIVIAPESNSNGTLTIKVNGVVVDGSYTIQSNGTYNVSVWIEETEDYKAGFNSTSFVVFKEASGVNISLVPARAGGKSVVYVEVTEGATGTVVVNVNGTEYPIDVSDKKQELILGVGEYQVFATYIGNYKYNMSVSDTKYLIVEDKLDANIVIQTIDCIKVGETLVINVTGDTTSDLTVTINTEKYDLADNKITYMPVKAGLYTINVFALENDDFKQANVSKTFNVIKHTSTVNTTVMPGKSLEDSFVAVSVIDGATGDIIVKLNNTQVYIGPVNESANVPLGKLMAGKYILNVTYTGSDYYNSSSDIKEFMIYKSQSSVFADSVEIIEGQTAQLKVNVNEGATGKVLVEINSEKHYGDIIGDVAVVDVSGLSSGRFNATITYLGDDRYETSLNNTLINVKKQTSGSDLNAAVPQGSPSPVFSIKLPADATGKLTVIVDGVTHAKDLVGGVAEISVGELSAGKHDIQLIYSGDDKYSGISKTTTVDIVKPVVPVKEKTTTAFVAKNKKFKAKVKVKKYTVTLKAGNAPVKNVWVTIKINGKTYKAKTNAKGKATFKIKKLTKKGKYKSQIKFAGNNNFKPSGKTVKITVK